MRMLLNQALRVRTMIVGALLACLFVTAAHATAAYTFDGKIGKPGTANGQFNEPKGLVFDTFGRMYVADRANSRIQVFDTYFKYFRKWASVTCQYVAVATNGDLYVTDSQNSLVRVFHPDGTPVTTFGEIGSAPGQLYIPMDIAIHRPSGVVYVADSMNNRVEKFDLTGGYLGTIGSVGTGNGQFDRPNGVAVDAGGNLYVADTMNNRLQKFNSTGGFVTAWGGGGSGDGQFSVPYDVTVDSKGFVYVADTFNHRVQKFGAGGAFITKFGTHGTGDGQFQYPGAVTTHGAKVYVSDTDNNRIQWFRLNNSPTAPTTVTATPTHPLDAQMLTASASGATDADGDTLTYSYAWFKSSDGTTWVPGPGTSTVPASLTNPGQYWKVRARAFDGAVYSPWRFSSVIRVAASAAPAILTSAVASGTPAGGAQITINLSAAANVGVAITNLAGRTVAVLPARDLPTGLSTLLWDGRSTSGTRTPAGQYVMVVTARTAEGGTCRSLTLPVSVR